MNHRRALVPILIALAAAACTDTGAPKPTLDVTIVVDKLGGPSVYLDADRNQLIECDPVLRAVVTGGGLGTWEDAQIRWYLGADRSKPIDSTTIAAADIGQAWGSSSLAVSDSLRSQWTLTAGLPFEAEFTYRYKVTGGADKRTTARVVCGPTGASTQPPTVSAPVLTARAGDLQPGDTVRVDYSATAAAQLWSTGVRLAGACDTAFDFNEGLAGTASRSVTIVLPASCRLGAELDLIAGAVDGAGRTASASVNSGRTLVDTRPPNVYSSFLVPGGPGLTSLRALAGVWFVGDTIQDNIDAVDNHQVAWIFWDEGTSSGRDSLLVAASTYDAARRFATPASWVGQPRLRFWARDASGLTSDTLSTAAGAVTIAPTVERPMRTTTLVGDVQQLAYDAKRQVVYLSQQSGARIAIVPMSTVAVSGYIALPAVPTSLDLTAGGDSLLALMPYSRSLAVIDLRGAAPTVTTLPIAVDTTRRQWPTTIRAMANGKALITLAGNDAATSLVELDLATGTERVRDAGRGSAPAIAVERSIDHAVGFINDGCLQRYDAASDSFTPCVASPTFGAPVVDASGATLAVGAYVFDGTPAYRVQAASVSGANDAALSPDGAALYRLSEYFGLLRFRTSDGAPLDAETLPFVPSSMLASSDGAWVILVQTSYTSAPSRIAVVDVR